LDIRVLINTGKYTTKKLFEENKFVIKVEFMAHKTPQQTVRWKEHLLP
jgi:hypothetical protein